MHLVAALRQLQPQFRRHDTAAAVGGITRNSNLHQQGLSTIAFICLRLHPIARSTTLLFVPAIGWIWGDRDSHVQFLDCHHEWSEGSALCHFLQDADSLRWSQEHKKRPPKRAPERKE